MPSQRAKDLLAELPKQHGLTPDQLWRNRDAGEVGELDVWAKHYGLKRRGWSPSSESMHGSQERFNVWIAQREGDESLRARVAKAIEDTE